MTSCHISVSSMNIDDQRPLTDLRDHSHTSGNFKWP